MDDLRYLLGAAHVGAGVYSLKVFCFLISPFPIKVSAGTGESCCLSGVISKRDECF